MTLPPTYTEEKATSLVEQTSPWIRLTGTYVKSVVAREEMTSLYFAAICFHIACYGARVPTEEEKGLRERNGILTVVVSYQEVGMSCVQSFIHFVFISNGAFVYSVHSVR